MNGIQPSGTELFKNLNPEKQAKVFDAAVREFASNGYRNASMNNVVKDAQISKGSLFQYFRCKRDLFDGVVGMAEREVIQYLKRVRQETAAMSFPERLELLLRAGFAFIDNHPLLARIYFHLLQSGEAPFGGDRILNLHRRAERFLADLIREGVEKGELNPDIDIERVAFIVNALLERLLRAYYTEFLAAGLGLFRGDAHQVDRWVATTVDFVSTGIANR